MATITIDGVEYRLRGVDPEAPNWTIELNGQNITDKVETFSAVNTALGMGFLYGMNLAAPEKKPGDESNRKARYAQGMLVNRGGSVILAHARHKDTEYVLVLDQVRILVGKDAIMEAPRGQRKLGEELLNTVRRELKSEAGFNVPEENIELMAMGNPDTALVFGANVGAFLVEIPDIYLDLDGDEPKLKPGISGESKLAEQILGAHFEKLVDVNSPSIYTQWAVGLLCQRLLAQQSNN